MHEFLNTLYVTTERTYMHLDHDTLRMELSGETKFRMPLLHLGAIFCFGDVLISPALLHRCADDGRSIVLLDRNGHFKGRLEGATSGNVLLRRAQHQALSSAAQSLTIARNCVAGKIQNCRQILLRGAREATDEQDTNRLSAAAQALGQILQRLEDMSDSDALRGCEGEAARTYFAAFDAMIREDRQAFAMTGRSRRPPLDRLNALLSFAYTLLLGDCVAGVEGVGLDPQVGYLHALRPGRPALALDIVEELRPVIADRLVLSLINRRQIKSDDFVERPGGSISLTDEGRRTFLVGYQQRKQDEVQHRLIGKKMPFGLIPHVQARLLARHLRGDLEAYPPFLYR